MSADRYGAGASALRKYNPATVPSGWKVIRTSPSAFAMVTGTRSTSSCPFITDAYPHVVPGVQADAAAKVASLLVPARPARAKRPRERSEGQYAPSREISLSK